MTAHYAENTATVSVKDMVSRFIYEVVGTVETIGMSIAGWNERRAAAHHLEQLPEHLLQDIGVKRGDIRHTIGG